MKWPLVLWACFILSCSVTLAQSGSKNYALFKKELLNLRDDTNKVLRNIEFAKALGAISPDTILIISREAKALSYKLHYPKGIERAIFLQGILAENRKDYPAAIRYYSECAKIAELYKITSDIYLTYNVLLNLYYYQADYPNAMGTAQKGLSLAAKLKDKVYQAYYGNQIGCIYQKQDKADESIKYGTQYLKLANELNNRMMIADASNTLADAYLLKKEYKTSLSYLFKALSIYDKMNTMEKLNKTQVVFKFDRTVYTLYKISVVYKQTGYYKLALKYSPGGIELHKAVGINLYDRASYYINRGNIYSLLKNYKQAGFLLSQGLSISKTILHREDIRDAYEGLSKNFALQNRFDSAYHYYILFNQLKDVIRNEKVSRELNKLEVERRDKEIILLNQQQKIKETETERQNLTRNFIVGFVTLLAIIAFLLLYIETRVRHQKLAFEKKLAIQAERQRISGDMHDDIGTGLSTMLIYINMLKLKLATGEHGANIDRIAVLGTELVEQMKEIVWSLSPGNDRLDSLLLFIRQYFAILFEPLPYHINIIFPTTIPPVQVESELRRNIFLCVKESLNNVIKHACATSVELHIAIINNTLLVQIKDNGRGFSIAPANATGNGLKNISQRMNAINGKSNIAIQNGTVVTLEVDLPSYPNG